MAGPPRRPPSGGHLAWIHRFSRRLAAVALRQERSASEPGRSLHGWAADRPWLAPRRRGIHDLRWIQAERSPWDGPMRGWARRPGRSWGSRLWWRPPRGGTVAAMPRVLCATLLVAVGLAAGCGGSDYSGKVDVPKGYSTERADSVSFVRPAAFRGQALET